ncbi:MAG: MFS transporter, partial [Pseudomonadota bacterium]
LFAGVFLDTAVQAGVLVFVAFLMIDKGVALHLATLATVVLLVGGIFGKAFCGFLADRIGIRRAFAAVQVLTAVGLVAIVVAPEWLVYVILLPLGAVAQGSSSITYAVVADLVHPKRMARGYALVYGASSYSSAAGPLGFGVIADAFGIGSAIYVMAAIALVAAVPVYLVPRKIGQHTA